MRARARACARARVWTRNYAKYLLFLLVLFSPLLSAEDLLRRINSSLLIADPSSAYIEVRQALVKEPNNRELWELYIRVLAKGEKEEEMIEAWKIYESYFSDVYKNHQLIEAMAWGVIQHGAHSSSPIIRIAALLGAFHSQDFKGVKILEKSLQDDNSLVRSIAVQLVSKLRDGRLVEAILSLIKKETKWLVRIELIKAIGEMQIKTAQKMLLTIIEDPYSLEEEKIAAIQSLVLLLDDISPSRLLQLTKSNRAGLRLLACEALSYFNMPEEECLSHLLIDTNSEVKIAALQTLGSLSLKTLGGNSIIEVISKMAKDLNYKVAITAAWLLALNDSQQGLQALEKWLVYSNQEARLWAAAAIAKLGSRGSNLLLKYSQAHPDHYVRVNLAIGMIGQRKETQIAGDTVFQFFMTDRNQWGWSEWGLFKALTPSSISGRNHRPEELSFEHEIAALDLLNILAVLKYDKAQEALASFLQKKSWGISGSASATLLTEGNDAAVDLVKEMLHHSSCQLRVQAALILSLWGRDPAAIATLQTNYAQADRLLKEKILQGIGSVGDLSSLPFLIKGLSEPYQILRLIAASSILQCLYH